MNPFFEQIARLLQVSFEAPERLWIAVPVLAVLLLAPLVGRARFRRSLIPFLLRAAALLALLVVVLEPKLPREETAAGRLLVLADVSPSVGESGLKEAQDLLARARSPFDLVAFGATPELIGEGLRQATLEADKRPATDLASALRLATARGAAPDPLRVVLVTDGRPTASGTDDAALRLRSEEIELWALSIPAETTDRPPAVRALGIELPPPRERIRPFDLKTVVRAEEQTRVKATLFLDGKPQATREVEVSAGKGEVVFPQLSLPAGRYHAQVLLEGDDSPTDNLASTILAVPGIPRVVVLADSKRKSLIAESLKTQGMQVEVAAASQETDLSETDAVVLLPDAPVRDLEQRAPALAEFVGHQGGGLLAIGGTEGPGLARLHATPTAQLLPLDVPARKQQEPEPPSPEPGKTPRIEIIEEETQAYPITLCLVVDRSGSMQGRKMRQAKAAAGAAAQALTPQDRIAVIAFGDQAHLAVKPRPAGDSRGVLMALDSLQPFGKTAMFHALQLAFAVLQTEGSPVRHIVLISDGIPTDDGPWLDLVSSMTKQKITVSTVGIGFNVDTWRLGRLAAWGKGMYWSANHPHQIPQVVTQDTQRVVAARDRRGEDAERTKPDEEEPEEQKPQPEDPDLTPPPPPPSLKIVPDPSAPREMLKGMKEAELPEVAGVEEGELRFAAWAAARAGEGGPPLLAYSRVGLGTTAALMVDPEAPGARELREHEDFTRLMAQLVRSVLPDSHGDPFLVDHTVEEDRLTIRVVAEDGLPRTDLPIAVFLGNRALETRRRAGRFEILLPPRADPGQIAIRIGPAQDPLLEHRMMVPASGNAELTAVGVDRSLLMQLTGDPDHLDAPVEQVLRAPELSLTTQESAELPFLLLAAILLPLDAWARRRAISASR
ncbi:MAG: VWA domain-containing protein [Planctomycetota bacterium]